MGFTGKKAAAFKEAYISEFNRMEAELIGTAIQPVKPRMVEINEYQLYSVCVLMTHFNHLYDIYKNYDMYNSLKALGSRAGIEMLDHFVDGAWQIPALKQLEPEFEAVQKRLGLNQHSMF